MTRGKSKRATIWIAGRFGTAAGVRSGGPHLQISLSNYSSISVIGITGARDDKIHDPKSYAWRRQAIGQSRNSSLACAPTHRRVFLKDLLDYKKQREQARRESITRIARQSEELGDYDKFIPPEE